MLNNNFIYNRISVFKLTRTLELNEKHPLFIQSFKPLFIFGINGMVKIINSKHHNYTKGQMHHQD